MSTKLMMSIQIASIAVLTTILAASVILSATANLYALAKPNDKCFTQQSRDGSSTSIVCYYPLTDDKEERMQAHDEKKQCQEDTDDKCTSSQTGNGEFGNIGKSDNKHHNSDEG